MKVIPKSKHVCSFILNFLLWADIIFILLAVIFGRRSHSAFHECFKALQEFWYLFTLPYIFYLIEVFCSSTFKYLINIKESNDVVQYVVDMKKGKPVLEFWCECYHYETRTRWVTEHYTENTSKGPEQRTRQKMETYTEKVVTSTHTDHFQYRIHNDFSGLISDDVYKNDLIKINFITDIQFGNEYTRLIYN